MKTIVNLVCICALINSSEAVQQRYRLAQRDIENGLWADSYISAAVNEKEQKDNFEDANVQMSSSESIESAFQETVLK